MDPEIYTFGYEGLSVEEFIARLRLASVQTVIDVRANPLSRKPGLSKKALALHLSEADIQYVHVVELGCPKAIRDRYRADRNWGAYVRAFLQYIAGQRAAVDCVASIARRSRCCLICFEADFNFCHRTFVGRALAKIVGARLVHLTATMSVEDREAKSAA